jgi:hypothetical protein
MGIASKVRNVGEGLNLLKSQGGGEKRKPFSEKTEKTRRKRNIKVFCSFFLNFPHKKGDNFSLRKLRKSGEREKEKVVLLFFSTSSRAGETPGSTFQRISGSEVAEREV